MGRCAAYRSPIDSGKIRYRIAIFIPCAAPARMCSSKPGSMHLSGRGRHVATRNKTQPRCSDRVSKSTYIYIYIYVTKLDTHNKGGLSWSAIENAGHYKGCLFPCVKGQSHATSQIVDSLIRAWAGATGSERLLRRTMTP